ncbi:MAG: FliM/FliN family flagellar motor C-terminal domain-containing protein [Candidatus Eremiobacteraeota bacterium]|nr:FliM/FliN family flagellar motor C-terminal domain-containing protein [Candidatus Eremiobacteraeota bacterium]
MTFAPQWTLAGSRRVRETRFDVRSLLPLNAACLVANSVREGLATLYGSPVHLRLLEPALPTGDAWAVVARDAFVYSIKGSRNGAAIVIRPQDAVALAAHAFGEAESEARPLSVMETRVLERAVLAIANACAAVCGAYGDSPALEAIGVLDGFATYFELQTERPVRARIGIALSRDPQPVAQAGVRLEDLLDLDVELAVRIEGSDVPAGDLAMLEPGALVPITKERALCGTVFLAGRPLASGECGVRDGRFALAIVHPQKVERGIERAS